MYKCMFAFVALIFSASTFAAAPQVVPTCSWDQPGQNRFTGNVIAAVDNYKDIPVETREKLKKRLANPKNYDDNVVIKRNGIVGSKQYDSELSQMHFGANKVCQSVTRDKWKEDQEERGLVFCEDGYCVVLPTVCGNLSRVNRRGSLGGGAPGEHGGAPYEELAYMPALPPELTTFANPQDPFEPLPVLNPPLLPTDPLFGPGPGGGWNGGWYNPPAVVFFPPVILPPGKPPFVGPPTPPVINPPTTPVPEPETWALMIIGIVALVAAKKLKGR